MGCGGKPLKVLVTGGAGFIGSHLVDSLLDKGHSVVVVDDLSSGRREQVNPAARFYQLDIRERRLEEVFQQEKPDLVNHHAAHIDVRRSVADPLFDAHVNVLGSLNLLECARQHGVNSFIYASSGGAIYGEPSYLPCDEEHPLNPISPYGVSKLTVEKYLLFYGHAHGLRYTILRYPNVYGPRQDPTGEAGVVAIFARRMLMGERVTINGSGEQERDFVYVDDIVAANLLAMENMDGATYNLGCGSGTSVNGLFATMSTMIGYPLEPVHGPPKLGEAVRIYLDGSRAQQELRWRPKVDLEDGLRGTIASFCQPS
jgi:UDP-glucose 4-epimerase